MKIRRDYENIIKKVYQQENAQLKESERNSTIEEKGDRVEISSRLTELRKELIHIEERTPEQEKRIEELAEQVRKGSYQTDAREIAEYMLKEKKNYD